MLQGFILNEFYQETVCKKTRCIKVGEPFYLRVFCLLVLSCSSNRQKKRGNKRNLDGSYCVDSESFETKLNMVELSLK